MGVKKCEIFFDNQWNTYYAGQTVKGFVDFVLDSPEIIKGIKIRIKGEANTFWNQRRKRVHRRRKGHRPVILTGHEDYLEFEKYLIGAENGEEIELPIGNHRYSFTCDLPTALPSSFEAEYGHIRYVAKISLDRVSNFIYDSETPFTVISPLDLNLNPGLKEPVQVERTKTISCWLFITGPVTLSVSMPVRGYASGQKIPVKIECNNGSGITIKSINITLRKFVFFHSHSPGNFTKSSKFDVKSITTGPVGSKDMHSSVQLITVPSLPPSNLNHCGIIDLEYDLKVQIVPQHRELEIKIPITLGTIPLIETLETKTESKNVVDKKVEKKKEVTEASSANNVSNVDANNLPSTSGLQTDVSYSDIPPPTYEECVSGTKLTDGESDDEDSHVTDKSQQFIPKYPVYYSSDGAGSTKEKP